MKKPSPLNPWILWGLVGIWWVATFFSALGEEGFDFGEAGDSFGWLAWIMLVATVYLGIFSQFSPRNSFIRMIVPLRKHTGLLAFLSATFHGVLQLGDFGVLISLADSWELATYPGSLLMGTLAWFAMLPVFITSSHFAMRLLGRHWKIIQSLVHFSFFFGALHIGLITGDQIHMILVVFYLLAYLFISWKKKSFQKPFMLLLGLLTCLLYVYYGGFP